MKEPSHHSMRFKIGVLLIVLNYVCFGLMLLCGVIAARYKSTAWAITGGISYALSWVLIVIGIMLAGPDGIKYVRSWLRPLLRKVLRVQKPEDGDQKSEVRGRKSEIEDQSSDVGDNADQAP